MAKKENRNGKKKKENGLNKKGKDKRNLWILFPLGWFKLCLVNFFLGFLLMIRRLYTNKILNRYVAIPISKVPSVLKKNFLLHTYIRKVYLLISMDIIHFEINRADGSGRIEGVKY